MRYRFACFALVCLSLAVSSAGAAPSLNPAATLPISQAQFAQLLAENREETRTQIAAMRPSLLDKSLPAIAAIVASVLTSIVAYLLQRSRLNFDRQSSFQKAGVEAIATLNNFRSRQLYEFYAPLEALLTQSLVLRDELYQRLHKVVPASVRLEMREDPGAGAGASLYIQHPGENFRPFRLIDEMWFIQKHCSALVPNVSAMVNVNQKVAKLLLDKVGFALPDSVELSAMFGRYLAHQSVLEEVVASAAMAGSKATPLDYTTSYPRGLNALISSDTHRLRKELAVWERQARQWMDTVDESREQKARQA